MPAASKQVRGCLALYIRGYKRQRLSFTLEKNVRKHQHEASLSDEEWQVSARVSVHLEVPTTGQG